MGKLIKAGDLFVRQEVIKLHGKETTCYFDKYGNVYFEAQEQCKKLGIRNVSQALETIPNKGKVKLLCEICLTYSSSAKSRARKTKETLFVNEGGLNMLILKSKKPEAMKYKIWIAFDLLPLIRKLGGYSIGEFETIKLEGITVRRIETDAIQVFIAYAIAQGANESGAANYYSHITKLVNKLLQIESRDTATAEQLADIALLERVVQVSLYRCMDLKLEYKKCYKLLKSELAKAVELLGLNK